MSRDIEKAIAEGKRLSEKFDERYSLNASELMTLNNYILNHGNSTYDSMYYSFYVGFYQGYKMAKREERGGLDG